MKQIIFISLLILRCGLALGDDDFALVSLPPTASPAVDLVYKGNPIDQDQAANLRKQGVDLSTLDPVANDMFGKPNPAKPVALPVDGATVDWDSALAGFGHEISIHRVISNGTPLRLEVSTVSHRALLTRALLSRLGYNQYAPKRYTKLTIRFKSLADRAAFLDAIALDTVKDPSTWVVDQPANAPTLTVQDVLMEPGDVQIQNFYWGILASDFSENRRAIRATLIPISLCDAPENIDSYSWDGVRVFSNDEMIPYPHEIDGQRPFDGVAIEDVQWIAKKIAKLTLSDWQAVVSQADYPPEIGDLVLQKLLSRRAQLLADSHVSSPTISFNTHFSNDCVKNGEVTCASFPGYASRFTYGAADDPMSPSELGDFGALTGINSALVTLGSQVSKQLAVFNASQAAQAESQHLMNGFLQHLTTNPGQAYSTPISAWGGPLAGFSVTASRQVTTGTFYGSDAPIQFVDSVGVGANIGAFGALTGLKNFIPMLQVSLSVNRTYAHVRPLAKVSDGLKVPVGDFIIPKVLNDLAVILTDPTKTSSESAQEKSKTVASYNQAVQDFLGQIGDGELFTITDTIAGGPAATVVVPLQALLPTLPVGFNQNIQFGASVQGMIAKRTTFRRVHDATSGSDYLQIYVQKIDSVTGSLTLDFNYYINIVHIGTDSMKGQEHSRVYTVNNDPNRSEDASKTLALGISQVLRSNSDTSLQATYPFYLLDHTVSETDWNFSFLFFQTKDLTESHTLTIQPPTETDHSFNPKDFQRNFYAYRELQRTGMNFLSVLDNLVGSVTGGGANLGINGGSDNPAYSPLGSAHWTETYSDAELTKGTKYTPVTISRETWAGWSLSADQLGQVFDSIDAKLGDLRSFGYKISPIHRNVFAATDALELYNITSSMVFYNTGVNKIVADLRPSPAPGLHPPTDGGADSYTATDPQVYKTLISWLGNTPGYGSQCNADPTPVGSGMPVLFFWRGYHYPCFDSFIQGILEMRRTLPSSSQREAQLQWQTKLLETLAQKVPLSSLMKAAGKDGFYYQVQVNGFRKGDNEAKNSEDQEVIASYVSDTVGTADTVVGAGALSTLAQQTNIMPYEINALYFTGGD